MEIWAENVIILTHKVLRIIDEIEFIYGCLSMWYISMSQWVREKENKIADEYYTCRYYTRFIWKCSSATGHLQKSIRTDFYRRSILYLLLQCLGRWMRSIYTETEIERKTKISLAFTFQLFRDVSNHIDSRDHIWIDLQQGCDSPNFSPFTLHTQASSEKLLLTYLIHQLNGYLSCSCVQWVNAISMSELIEFYLWAILQWHLVDGTNM